MKKGFTLIELLIVIAIIGVIAAIVIPALVAKKHQNDAVVEDNSCRKIGAKVAQGVTLNPDEMDFYVDNQACVGEYVTKYRGVLHK